MTEPAAPGRGILARIHALTPALPPAAQRVARAVVEDPDGIAASSIGELAERAGTSETTVVRFCRALGVPGYTRLRLALATELGRLAGRNETTGPVPPGDDLDGLLATVGEVSATAIGATLTNLDRDALARVVDALAGADRIAVYGFGVAGPVAAAFDHGLCRSGRSARAHTDPELATEAADRLTGRDAAIGVCHTGTSPVTLAALRLAAERGATTVAITNFPRSPLGTAAEVVLATLCPPAPVPGPVPARLAQLALVDCVCAALAGAAG